MHQNVHYNHNMNVLNLMQEEVDFLNLNGGYKHMPPLDWSVDQDRVNAYGRKMAIGLARVLAEMLAGNLAPRLISCFKPRTAEEEAESVFPTPPNL